MYKKSITHALLIIFLLIFANLTYAISQYTVKSGNSLWGIANDTKPSRKVSTPTMIKAIKGLNLEDYPNIINNIVRKGQTLTIPTSNQEIQDGLSIYKASQTPDGYQPELTSTSTRNDNLITNSTNTTTNLQQENQRLIEENHQLRTAFKAYQENAQVSVNTLNKELQAAQNKHFSSLGWVIAIIFLMIILVLFYKNRKYQKFFNQIPDQDLSTEHPDHIDSTNISAVEPTLFSDDSPHINVNEALVEAMIMLEEGDKQGAKLCLQTALNNNPDSIDVRIKLLEVYGAENDIVSFNSEKDYLSAHLLAHDDARWEEIDKIYTQYFVK